MSRRQLAFLLIILLWAPCSVQSAGLEEIEQAFAETLRHQQRARAMFARVVENRNAHDLLLGQLVDVRTRCQSGGSGSPGPVDESLATSTRCLDAVTGWQPGACSQPATPDAVQFEQTLQQCEVWLEERQNAQLQGSSPDQTRLTELSTTETALLSRLEVAERETSPATRAAQLAAERFFASATHVESLLTTPGDPTEQTRRAELREGLTRLRASSQFQLAALPFTDRNPQCSSTTVAAVAPDPVLTLLAERLQETRAELTAATSECLARASASPRQPAPLPQPKTQPPQTPLETSQATPSDSFNPLLESGVPGRGASFNTAKQIAEERLKAPIVQKRSPSTGQPIQGYGEPEPQPAEQPFSPLLDPALGTGVGPGPGIGIGTSTTTRNARQDEMAKDFIDPPTKQ